MGSVLIMTGRVVTAGAGVDDTRRSELLGWAPCSRVAEEPQLTGTEVADAAGVARGAGTCKVAGVEVELVAWEGRPGNRARPGVEDLCGAGTAGGP